MQEIDMLKDGPDDLALEPDRQLEPAEEEAPADMVNHLTSILEKFDAVSTRNDKLEAENVFYKRHIEMLQSDI